MEDSAVVLQDECWRKTRDMPQKSRNYFSIEQQFFYPRNCSSLECELPKNRYMQYGLGTKNACDNYSAVNARQRKTMARYVDTCTVKEFRWHDRRFTKQSTCIPAKILSSQYTKSSVPEERKIVLKYKVSLRDILFKKQLRARISGTQKKNCGVKNNLKKFRGNKLRLCVLGTVFRISRRA